MALYQQHIIDIHQKLQGVIGKKAWGVKRGSGSFLTIEFGQPLLLEHPDGVVHGEWHLWIYGSKWRIEDGESIIVASYDTKTKVDSEVPCLEGKLLRSFEVTTPALDALLTFENNFILRLFNAYSEKTEDNGMDSWMLYTPDKENVITIHADGKWSYGL